LAKGRCFLEDKIRPELNFDEIVGESVALKQVLNQARTVASSDATVLILGETGTGKELIARAIHRMSSRSRASFIKLNCAVIPAELLESELFGHEKGAFTGSVSRKTGRLEAADKGTLFLDEFRELPLEVQPKLLRVLEDQEFERLGGTLTIRVDIRLIAATNRDLAKSIAEQQFRSDLYYRLNVFPVRMPALRERKEDIPLLVHHLVKKFARRMNKQIEVIPTETMNALVSWSWPGNVRELENFIERSVIRSQGPILDVPLVELGLPARAATNDSTREGS
jgi:formate hydrogenlyase transcriptional activator